MSGRGRTGGGARGQTGGSRGGGRRGCKGARQPLSQQRPGTLRKRLAGSAGTKGTIRGAERAGGKRGAPPPTNKVPPRTPSTVINPRRPKPSERNHKQLGGIGAWESRPLAKYAAEVFRRLHTLYPNAYCELDYTSPWQLIVATVLSAQCTDKRVNLVTPALFAVYPTPAALAAAQQSHVEEIIKSTGFFRNKAKAIIGLAGAVHSLHHGEVPPRMADLITLPGVGRKTANVILGNAFAINDGVVVDTHVARLSHRIGLTFQKDPLRIEQDLMVLFPRKDWTMLAHLLIWHGRRICEARRPRCPECPLADICPSSLIA
ncbi:MAG: Endonuclease III [Gemmatimonadaceae bacterium]|nr:Endonuclease III [Gemmatimonadaceae bacterium]